MANPNDDRALAEQISQEAADTLNHLWTIAVTHPDEAAQVELTNGLAQVWDDIKALVSESAAWRETALQFREVAAEYLMQRDMALDELSDYIKKNPGRQVILADIAREFNVSIRDAERLLNMLVGNPETDSDLGFELVDFRSAVYKMIAVLFEDEIFRADAEAAYDEERKNDEGGAA